MVSSGFADVLGRKVHDDLLYSLQCPQSRWATRMPTLARENWRKDEQNAARAIAWTRAVCVLVSAASPSDISGVFDKVIDDPRFLCSWLHGSAVWPLVIDGVSACSNARRAARLVDQWSRPMRRGSTLCGDELATRDTGVSVCVLRPSC